MPHGRRTALRPALTPAERAALASWVRSKARRAEEVQRARLVLLVADGLSLTETGRVVGLSRGKVALWLTRWQAEGLAGLVRRRRGG